MSKPPSVPNIPGSMYEGLQFLRNHVHHTNGTGEGFYLGCNNNACTMFDSLIEGNYIHDTNQPTVSQGDGIEIKVGSYGNVVRDNLIHGWRLNRDSSRTPPTPITGIMCG